MLFRFEDLITPTGFLLHIHMKCTFLCMARWILSSHQYSVIPSNTYNSQQQWVHHYDDSTCTCMCTYLSCFKAYSSILIRLMRSCIKFSWPFLSPWSMAILACNKMQITDLMKWCNCFPIPFPVSLSLYLSDFFPSHFFILSFIDDLVVHLPFTHTLLLLPPS